MDMSFGDLQAEQDAPSFTQLWTHSCFSGAALNHSTTLPCFAFVQFPLVASPGGAILHPKTDDLIEIFWF